MVSENTIGPDTAELGGIEGPGKPGEEGRKTKDPKLVLQRRNARATWHNPGCRAAPETQGPRGRG